jgi:carbon starvation protein
MRKVLWTLVAVIGAFAVGGIALKRGETINAMWLVVAAVCVYALGYRFYSAWVAAKVLSVDPERATPALRLNNGRDFVPTHRWIVFGHHFAAIAGPGPLIGPTLAARCFHSSSSPSRAARSPVSTLWCRAAPRRS